MVIRACTAHKIIPLFFLFFILIMGGSWREETESRPAQIRNYVLAELKQISVQLSSSLAPGKKTEQLREHYSKARRHYKHIEYFVEYVSPRAAKYFINGPLVPRYDEEQGRRALAPNGFQRIEEILFTEDQLPDTAALNAEYRMLLSVFSQLQIYYGNMNPENGLALEMCQYELYRIAAINLAGFDASLTKTNIAETVWCMEGMESAADICYAFAADPKAAKKQYRNLKSELASAKKALSANPDFDSFDRLRFITKHINPLNQALIDFHTACGFAWNINKQPLILNRPFLFGNENLSIRWFAHFYEDSARLHLQMKLGEKLFYDPLLSGNGKQSCAGCHDPSKGFTDGLPKSRAIDNGHFVLRNAPTLLNAVYQKSFFADGRVFHLEQQIGEVLASPDEMGSSLTEAVKKLRMIPEYRKLFAAAFAGSPDSVISPYAVQKAITEYEKTLVSFDSRFDRYLRGDEQAMNEREINGYNLFEGKALCGSCHFMPLFNGTAPPFFSDSEFEVIGVPASPDNNRLDPDSGRYRFTKIPEQLHAFKTPTVRNIEITAPYMHNGVYSSLEEVVEFYHKGGGAGLGLPVPNQTLPFDSLQLNQKEKEDIILFMKSLTDPKYAQ